jgi:hypothetical protein
MKLEYLSCGCADCPLIRIYDFRMAEAAQLMIALRRLASGVVAQVPVHGLPGVEGVGGCRLTLVLSSRDQAVLRQGPADFTCSFTAGTWDNVVGLVEPFAKDSQGFQWLANVPGEAALLLSPTGQW